VIDLFRTIRQSSESPSRNIFYHVKEPLVHASWSALSFLYERDPAFLDCPDDEIKESICGFVLLVEYRDFVALFKSNLDVASAFKTEYFDRIPDSRVEAAIARVDAINETAPPSPFIRAFARPIDLTSIATGEPETLAP